MPPDKKPPETLDEKVIVVAVEEEKTRYVKPYRDHGVESTKARPPSISQMAAQAAPVGDSDSGVSGRLVQADFDGGDITIRLTNASASMRALAQLLAAQGLEVEIVVRRRIP